MVAVYELNSNRNYIGAPFDYNGRKIVYTGQTQQKQTTDWQGNRIMDVKYIFTELNGNPIELTAQQVVTLQPMTMGGRMMRRQRSQRRGRQQRRQRTQRRQRSQRRGRQQRRQRTQRRH